MITAPSINPLLVMAMGAVALTILMALVPPVMVPLMVEEEPKSKASPPASMAPLLAHMHALMQPQDVESLSFP